MTLATQEEESHPPAASGLEESAARSHVRTSPFTAHDWRRSPIGRALTRAFTPPPDEEIWEWADKNVLLQNEDAAEPGNYRANKTPWTKRLQELIRRPEMWVWSWTESKYIRVPVTEVNIVKSSQSGYSEACLNGIRWRANYRPCNTIYAIDSADEAKKIAQRLLRSLRYLDPSIFTGDPDDIKSLEFQLRGMLLWFIGSFSSGKAANKQAPYVIADEVEEHGGNILGDLASRKKTSTGGLQINLSKPKLKNGPIHRAFLRGNQEEFFVPCPHCGHLQYLTFFPEERDVPFADFDDLLTMEDGTKMPRPLPLGEKRRLKTGRFVFEHCKNLLGQWDRLRVQQESYYECASCQGHIEEHHKRGMLDRAQWLPLELHASPGIVSQHISDFLSEDELSTFGRIADEYIEAKHDTFRGKRSLEGKSPLQDWYNHRCGRVWSEEGVEITDDDITINIAGRPLWFVDGPNEQGQLVRNIFTDAASAERLATANQLKGETTPVIHSACPPYKRGTIPFLPHALIGGSDVGGNYARWGLIAVHPNLADAAVVDWGEELDPAAVLQLIQKQTWPVVAGVADPGLKRIGVQALFMDARFRARDVYDAALQSRGQLIPCQGMGGAVARSVRLWSYNSVPTYEGALHKLDYNDQRAKDALYLDRIKRKRKRLWWPMDVEEDPRHIEELTAERQVQDRAGRWYWPDIPTGPNHDGDTLKNAVLGMDFMSRGSSAGI